MGRRREAGVRAEAVEEARQRIALLSKTKPEDTEATAKQRITLLSKTKTEGTKATAKQEQELYPLPPGGYSRVHNILLILSRTTYK